MSRETARADAGSRMGRLCAAKPWGVSGHLQSDGTAADEPDAGEGERPGCGDIERSSARQLRFARSWRQSTSLPRSWRANTRASTNRRSESLLR